MSTEKAERKPKGKTKPFKILAIIEGGRRILTIYATSEQKAREKFLEFYPLGAISKIAEE